MGLLKNAVKPSMAHSYVGAPSFRSTNPYSLLENYNDDYASLFPSIKAVAQEFMTIRPFAIGANGEPKQNVPALNALYHPNQSDSSVAFAEKLAVMNLTHRKTYLLVWRREGSEAKPGGEINPQNIGGFTFLEYPAITRRDGRSYYTLGSQEFNDSEVIIIPGGVDPYDLYGGYAPGEAARRWAKLDDYIADYQAGFFENGAVPSGQFIITSSNQKDFEDTVTLMQSRHRGAGNNNNVTYTPRPVDPTTGKPADAKIEWIPFASSNKDIDFKNLFEQANHRIDSTYGVPASVRGVGENNNYATAKTDQQNFIRFTVSPLALRIYTQITHELNRITGGLGVAITFKLELPAIADEEKAIAETKNVEVTALNALLAQGFSLDTVVDALQLSPSYKLLEVGVKAGDIDNDKPDVDEGGEVIEAPDPEKIDGVTPLNVRNKINHYDDLYKVARGTMKRQIDDTVSALEEDDIKNAVSPEPELKDEDQFIQDMMEPIAEIILTYGVVQYALGEDLLKDAGKNTDNLTEFIFTDTAQGRYEGYLRKVGNSYLNDNAESIRNVLAEAKANEWTVAETKRNLRDIIRSDEYRIKRLAETELNRSQSMGSIEAMIEIKNQTGYTIEKSLQHTGADTPCEFCAELLDRWVEVGEVFVAQGETITGRDGGMYANNFSDNAGYGLHPNDHCVPEYRVV